MSTHRPKVLFLYSNERTTAWSDVVSGKNHGAGFWGMTHLSEYGLDGSFLELEQYLPKRVVKFLRRYVNVYFIHAFFFFKLVRYDIVYTSAAFGTQFLHALYPFKKPLWVMHDFSIASIVGAGTTRRQRLFKWLVSRCDGIVTLGEEEAERLRSMFPHLRTRIRCIPYGADLTFFVPGTGGVEDKVFGVGRDPDRDWKLVMSVAPLVPADIIIATHERRVAHLRPFPPNVMVGQFSPQELITHYQSAKVVVLPLDTSSGLNDAMGVSVLYEALALGKALIATNTHTMRSYITHGENGLLVPEGDREALAEALALVLRDDDLRVRLERAARAYAERSLELKTQTKVLADYFLQVLEHDVPKSGTQ